MIDPIVAWYLANLNEDWEHSFGVEVRVMGHQEYLVKLDLNWTVITSNTLHRVPFGMQSGGWLQMDRLHCRGHWNDFQAAADWIGATLKFLLREAANETEELLDVYGVKMRSEFADSAASFAPNLLEIGRLVCLDCGLTDAGQEVIIRCDDRGLFEILAPTCPSRAGALFSMSAESFFWYVNPLEVDFELKRLQNLIIQ